MDRATLLELWTASWSEGIWIAPWSKAIDGVTAAQAAWQPSPGRHSIWQNVVHVMFWRQRTLDILAGRPKKSAEQTEKEQFAAPAQPTEANWSRAKADLAASHEAIRAAIADPDSSLERLKYHLAHDAYHLGQITFVRALQGLPPIE